LLQRLLRLEDDVAFPDRRLQRHLPLLRRALGRDVWSAATERLKRFATIL